MGLKDAGIIAATGGMASLYYAGKWIKDSMTPDFPDAADPNALEAEAKNKASEDARRRAKARNRNETVFTSPTGTAKPTVFKKKLGT